ncbi:MAG: hypothetical protein OXF82_03330, partial [Gammaproteobacteria bacterium]|nr:hypothetical protein [Gammaproteobacteria bacterium]
KISINNDLNNQAPCCVSVRAARRYGPILGPVGFGTLTARARFPRLGRLFFDYLFRIPRFF